MVHLEILLLALAHFSDLAQQRHSLGQGIEELLTECGVRWQRAPRFESQTNDSRGFAVL